LLWRTDCALGEAIGKAKIGTLVVVLRLLLLLLHAFLIFARVEFFNAPRDFFARLSIYHFVQEHTSQSPGP
jgi:hypothetical protein